jgi:hypothetical protein
VTPSQLACGTLLGPGRFRDKSGLLAIARRRPGKCGLHGRHRSCRIESTLPGTAAAGSRQPPAHDRREHADDRSDRAEDPHSGVKSPGQIDPRLAVVVLLAGVLQPACEREQEHRRCQPCDNRREPRQASEDNRTQRSPPTRRRRSIGRGEHARSLPDPTSLDRQGEHRARPGIPQMSGEPAVSPQHPPPDASTPRFANSILYRAEIDGIVYVGEAPRWMSRPRLEHSQTFPRTTAPRQRMIQERNLRRSAKIKITNIREMAEELKINDLNKMGYPRFGSGSSLEIGRGGVVSYGH